MCGIIGYVDRSGNPAVLDVLDTGLSSLAYRGYDSAGVALADDDLTVIKRTGEVDALTEALATVAPDDVSAGIGHTRWSTHGPPSDANAHPHTDCTGEVAVVHNGIIENYETLKAELTQQGHVFESETDTEVIPHLIEEALDRGGDRMSAFRDAIDRLTGSHAVVAAFADGHGLFATRRDSPLVVGLGDDGYYLASDVPAFVEYTDRVSYLDDGEFVRVTSDGVTVTDSEGTEIDKSVSTIDWDPEDAEKGGYEQYMLKEITEQPRALRKCLRGRVDEEAEQVSLDLELERESVDRIHLLACGSSYHAALYGAQLFRARGIPAQTFLASEYGDRALAGDTPLVIGVTQSGETADTLGALRAAQAAGAETLTITNTVGSSAARECDHALFVRAGPEIGVAATKTFANQQTALHLLALWLGGGDADPSHIAALRAIPEQVQSILDDDSAREVAAELVDSAAYFFIGRGPQHPIALEGALKLKEISYEHAEGFAAGELKHGPIALVTTETPIIAMVTGDDERARKTVGNVKEVQARGAPVVAVTDGKANVEQYAQHVLSVPETEPEIAALLANVQLQLLAYWIARDMGRPIDKPRNLAKSVTVE
ncbi:glutamine--fructose-6-phosphate transaminase (isomerizing) [Natranaeroarchaeum aerophilus]|uniref:Glutamine--fructose-6-phosphate aminotransferase [isomerizing] n=1 Tax=Natranaeroarchaeum aerophilus TaxID=2917711 RepID=A0AAE3FQX3_9EURY|nr:glutamine--fructose-6-phosphate transaminase (isomerizing) [Natranaeroarchaeum aerophilus]MCL9813501.1 glutamine--fructose-6-phosphate transaminase (isomerizing) [Natranaeroarchaeum aerophilus]